LYCKVYTLVVVFIVSRDLMSYRLLVN
jgi:hypothetical protein